MPSFSCTVQDNIPSGLRLDRYAAEYLKVLSRSQIKARNLKACLNGKAVKISRPLKGGDRLDLSWAEAESPFLVPQDIPLDVLYEDKRVIVVNKAQGMVVHPGAGNRQGTLANALLYRRLERNDDALPEGQRPGIVHRLDKDTSGVMIAAWDDPALAFLADQFKARKARKSYAALVLGCPRQSSGSINKRIARCRRNRKTFTVSDSEGRASLTHYKVIRTWGSCSLLLLRPKTGRTHQIRVHLKYLGNPILGDPLYGLQSAPGSCAQSARTHFARFKKATLMLHAKSLSLVLPGHESAQTFRTPLPLRFRELLQALGDPRS